MSAGCIAVPLWLPVSALLALVEKAQGGPDNLAGTAALAGGNFRIDEGLKFRRQRNVAGFALQQGAGELKQVVAVSIFDIPDNPHLHETVPCLEQLC